ncbi:hypothetical protein QIA20_05610 (plasmid) [Borreliella japonica]|uniref:hypothetical protein n=1 Tax=Borreliella japonica TaxID=34095 RepID=UPI003AB421AB
MFNDRIEQDNKNVNNTRKLFLEILKENSQKTGIYPSKIFSCLKGLFKALEIYQNTIVSLEYYPKYLGRQNRLEDILGVYVKNLKKAKKKGILTVWLFNNVEKNLQIRGAFMNLHNSTLKQDLEKVNKTKKYIFKNLHLEILEENSQTTEIYSSKIFTCPKGLFKALKTYQNTVVSPKYYPKYLGVENRLKDILEVYVKNLKKPKKKATLSS